ncbi:MAG: hypothetical protein O6849_04400, partial [Candidatus Dadabacteria bacterium]|nr:hypothetical protein [Candidatus Dadabacteria bacterium]
FDEFKSDFIKTEKDYCKPISFCVLSDGSCKSNLDPDDPLRKESEQICGTWAGKDIDCPLFKFKDGRTLPGCVGFAVTLGDSNQFKADNKPVPNEEPYASCFKDESPWNVIGLKDVEKLAGEGCRNQSIGTPQFCK